MTDALSRRDDRLGNFVRNRSVGAYADRFADHFVLSLDDRGVLTVRMHTDGGPAQWSRGLLNAWNLLLSDISADREVEAIILTGTGQSWIAGIQPESFATPPSSWHSDELDEQFTDSIHLLERLTQLDVPTIAALNGPGIRHEIALLCDLTLCSPDISLGDGNFAAGSVPGDGMLVALCQLLGPKRVAYLAYTNTCLNAEQALAAGLVNEIVDHDQLLRRSTDIAHEILSRPRTAVRFTHALLTRPWQRAVVSEIREHYALQLGAATRDHDNP